MAVGEEGDWEVRGVVGTVSWEGVVMETVGMEEGGVGRVEEWMEGLVGVKTGVGWGVMGVEKAVSLEGLGKVAAGKVGVVGVEKDLVGVVMVEVGVVVEVVRGISHRFSDNWPCGAWNTNCVH